MIEMYTLAGLAVFLLGVAGGFMVLMALANRRDRDITTPATDRLARGARTVNRLHTRGLGVHHEVAYRHDRTRINDPEW